MRITKGILRSIQKQIEDQFHVEILIGKSKKMKVEGMINNSDFIFIGVRLSDIVLIHHLENLIPIHTQKFETYLGEYEDYDGNIHTYCKNYISFHFPIETILSEFPISCGDILL